MTLTNRKLSGCACFKSYVSSNESGRRSVYLYIVSNGDPYL